MSVWDEAVGGHRVVVGTPSPPPGDWMAVTEVLLGEGVGALTMPVAQADDLAPFAQIFGRRVVVGVDQVVDAAGAARAREAGARFILASVLDPALREAAGDVPVVMGALTPDEIARAVRAGERAVVVTPVDVLGSAYVRTLPHLFPDVELIASGRLERFQADQWLEAGGRAVVTRDVVLREVASGVGNGLDEVAHRAAQFASLAT